MDEHLTHIIKEARRQDGLKTPPPVNTLYQLICGLHRYLKENRRPEVALLDEKWYKIDKTTRRKVLYARMKGLTAKGGGFQSILVLIL